MTTQEDQHQMFGRRYLFYQFIIGGFAVLDLFALWYGASLFFLAGGGGTSAWVVFLFIDVIAWFAISIAVSAYVVFKKRKEKWGMLLLAVSQLLPFILLAL